MPRNGLAKIDWSSIGPRALAWLTEETPRRHTLRGLLVDCHAALGVPGLRQGRLSDWLCEQRPEEWAAIRRTLGTGHAVAAMPAASGRSLTDYLLEKKRAACAVCALPADVLAQLAAASEKGIKVADRLEWLAAEYGAHLTRTDLEAHARHGT